MENKYVALLNPNPGFSEHAVGGTVGDIGCWSLNESKHIGAGDGAILLTNNKKLADRADLFAEPRCAGDRAGAA